MLFSFLTQRNSKFRFILNSMAVLVVLVLVSCANKPFKTEEVTVNASPINLLRDNAATRGRVLWGGVIISSMNLKETTRLEVLSYPLDYVQYPDTNRPATGRFLIRHSGYLETADFAPGRLVTVVGDLDGTETGTVGDSNYEYVRLIAGDLHLWSRGGRGSRPAFTFGVGIYFSN